MKTILFFIVHCLIILNPLYLIFIYKDICTLQATLFIPFNALYKLLSLLHKLIQVNYYIIF